MMVCEKSSWEMLDCPTYDMTWHLRPMYIIAQIDVKYVSRVFLDNSASINIMYLSTLTKLSRDETDLIPTVVMTNFTSKRTHQSTIVEIFYANFRFAIPSTS